MRILDAGCGTGLVTRHLSTLGKSLLLECCDFSDLRLSAAHAQFRKENIEARLYKADLNAIPIEDLAFDLVICRLVYSISPCDTVLAEFERIIKIGGQVCVIDVDGLFHNLHPKSARLTELLHEMSARIPIDFSLEES